MLCMIKTKISKFFSPHIMKANKKLLILGGANQHLKFVEAAKELGIYTIVTDYLVDSPCKRVADESLMLNITDIDGIVSYCRENHIDGVVAGFLDPCQMPYAKICEQLGLPCTGTVEQFEVLTNKYLFKELCKKHKLGIIHDYSEADFINNSINYPVFVKPVDSRGSRGQSVCYSCESMPEAIKFAKSNSSNGQIIIEDYMENCEEIQMTCFVVDGEVYLERAVDTFHGSTEFNLQKVANGAISPSKYTDLFMETVYPLFCNLIKDLGVKNGPIFMQGFCKDGKFYFFDQGLRFPGVEFERIYKKIYGIDFAKLLIQFALDGHFPEGTRLPVEGAKLDGNIGFLFFPVLRAGVIDTIEGMDEFKRDSRVVAFLSKYNAGDSVGWTYDVNQRYAEIDVVGEDMDSVLSAVEKFYSTVKIVDDKGEDMFCDHIKVANFYKS